LDHSAAAVLDDAVHDRVPSARRIVALGASYVSHPNVVLDVGDETVTSELDLDYRQLDIRTRPPWRSRFVRAPLEMPSAEEIASLVPDPTDSGMRLDSPPTEAELQPYELAPVIEHVAFATFPFVCFDRQSDSHS
jgi:hypothetical protein